MNATLDYRPTRDEWTHQNGVVIIVTNNNCYGVSVPEQRQSRLLKIEVDHLGKRYKEDYFDAINPFRDSLEVDLRECMVRVLEGDRVLAQLGRQPQGHLYQPWMVVQGEQGHITESYVSVPPALHLTDEVGDRWTLGMTIEPKERSPDGEFAFEVWRNGLAVLPHVIASRLERRGGKTRAFTRRGWVVWNGREFI